MSVSPEAPVASAAGDHGEWFSLRGFYARRHSVTAYPWTMAINEPAGAVLAFFAYRFKLSPNMVTTLSGVVSTLGALACAGTSTSSVVWAFVLLQLGYTLDCSDGQLARALRRPSPFGAWLDVAIDFLSNVTIPVALTAVALRHGADARLVGAFCVLLIYGQTLFLHTSSTKRKQCGTTKLGVSVPVYLFRLVADHGTFMAVVCVACALYVPAIPAVMLVYGLLYCALSVRIARSMYIASR